MSIDEPYRAALAELTDRDRHRALTAINGVDFSSNDYLGLAHHATIRAAMVAALDGGLDLGAGGSRLLRGNHPAHEALEGFAADFFIAPAALFMATGYLANLAVYTTLPQRGDVILFDERAHASMKEGIHAATAKREKIAHNDVDAFADAARRWRAKGAKRIWMAVESVYSMDGDVAPLADLKALADAVDAFLVVDEAHATGVHGPDGKGFSAALSGHENLVVVHTCGKALGQAGALVTLPARLKDYMINTGRSFIYTTAPPPLTALAVLEALKVVEAEPELRTRLMDLVAHAHRVLDIPGDTQILPLIVGADSDAVALACAVQRKGYDVRAVRPPTVAEGEARLRISITLNVNETDIDGLAAAIAEARS